MVLDPTCSSELRNRITDHAKSKACPHLSYHPSPPAQTTGTAVAKLSSRASLINFGITEASSFGVKGPAEYIAVLDAEVSPALAGTTQPVFADSHHSDSDDT